MEDKQIKIIRIGETRSKAISRMIGEGGMGADQYYQIVKERPVKQEYSHGEKELLEEISSMDNDHLLDLLVINAQQNETKEYNDALKIIIDKVLERMK